MIKVLIVEDDPMVAEFNKRYVEMVEGFALFGTASTAEEAMAILAEHEEEIDLILLDVFMPGMNGLDLLSEIRRIGKGVDVIIITAACDRGSIKKALRLGAVDYIIKPFEFERLNAALLAYQNLSSLMADQDRLNQEELDQCVLYKEPPLPTQLPKGIDRNTLKLTWEKIQERSRSPFSTEEMAKYVGISRVSMRKYLDFLQQAGVLKLELMYGTVGRPVYKYRCIDSSSNIVRRYL